MAKKQTPGEQNSTSLNTARTYFPSAHIDGITQSLNSISKISLAKIKPGDVADDSLPASDDDPNLVAAQSGDDQPVLMASVTTAESGVGGGSSGVTAAEDTAGGEMLLAMADGSGSVSGMAPSPQADESSGSISPWWLVGGLAIGGIGGAIAASGGGGGSAGPTSTTVSGTVTDGPVEGARLYYDVNANGTYDEGTDTAVLDANGNQVVTDADGNFSFTTSQNAASIRLVTAGGTDTVTGETVTLNFAAPAGFIQINPITSAIAAYMEANPTATAAQAETAVETALGLPDLDYSAVNLFDPPAEASAADILAAQKAAAVLATTAIVIEQSGTDADAFHYVAANMGTGGSTEALVVAVSADPSVVGTDAATQLNNTVTAINEADSVDAIGEAVTTVFFAEPPVIGDYTVSLNENSANGTAVATVAASDADGDALSYAITAGNASGAFAINSATGAISVADASQLDFETATSFSLTIEASDGTLTDTGTVTINLNDINDNTPVITSGGTGSVAENAAISTVIYDAAATDADAGSTITYSLKAGTGDVALLNIDSSTGQITLKNSADFETKAGYTFTVIASDGTNSSEQAVTVSVTDLNDNTPVITSGGTGSVAENAATSTVIYDAAATDADAGSTITYSLKPQGPDYALINIDSSTGEVRLNSSANYEGRASYSFTVIASDGTNSSEQAVTVSVTNVNESPSITSNGGGTSASLTIAENETSVVTVTATDPDAGDGKTFSISGGADQALFAIDSSTGALSFHAAPDFEAPADAGGNNVYDVQVTVTDAGGLTDVQDLAVTVNNVNEHFVVERTGVWFDMDADGFRDADETTAADFTPGSGNVDLTAIPAVIHFNNIPDGDISLAGFGADDLIEIDGQAFIDNGHNGLQLVTHPDIVPLDEFTDYAQSTLGSVVNFLVPLITTGPDVNVTGTRYFNSFTYSGTSGSTRTAVVGLNLQTSGLGVRRLSFTSSNGSSSTNAQLATGLPSNVPLQDMVDFVNLPVAHDPVHVLVERDGAFIDIDGDGVRDNGENRLAQFFVGGNADLENRSVVVHFNDVPSEALDLTGFGTDDKIQFDVLELRDNSILNYDAANGGIANISIGAASLRGYNFAWTTQTFTSLSTTISYNRIVVHQAITTTRTGFNGNSYGGVHGISINNIDNSISGHTGGIIAYWTDTGNALNVDANLLPDLVMTPTSNQLAVIDHLNANHYPGLVEFVWPVNVVVDGSGAWIDANADGYRDPGETTPADVTADLGSSPVTIHFNDIPATPLDFSGFGSDDLVVMDIDALRYGSPSNLRFSQSSFTTSTWSDFAKFSGVYKTTTSGYASVFLQGGALKFGHTTPRVVTSGGVSTTRYFFTANGSLEGTIAVNADALANHFDQVIFVTANAGPM